VSALGRHKLLGCEFIILTDEAHKLEKKIKDDREKVL